MDRLVFLPAHDLATRIRRQEVTATEVIEAHLKQIARHNPVLNAIVTLDAEGARQRAHEADSALARGEVWGSLHGVPFTVKDQLATAGLRTTGGLEQWRDHVPTGDAPTVARLRGAGGILLGKTNLPPGANDIQTDNAVFGRSTNPWDLSRTPGGSTGGGAAAVAAGLSPLELGADGGGSIRLPAHYCGVYGLKPTQQRVPFAGEVPPTPLAGFRRMLGERRVIGPLARSIEDLEVALRVLAGPHPHDWAVPPVPLATAHPRSLTTLRLAWTDDLGGVPVTVETRTALAHLAARLTEAGCPVDRRELAGLDAEAVWELVGELRQAEAGPALSLAEETALQQRLATGPDPVHPFVRGQARLVAAPIRALATALEQRDALIQRVEQFLARYDALLCPVASGPAFPNCLSGTALDVDGVAVPYWTAALSHCWPFSLTGHPAVVIPLTRSGEGLPIGVQLVGHRWGELELLAIAQQLQQLIGPCQPPPGY